MAKYSTVAELLEDESRWCQMALARDEEGIGCDPESDEASSWCAIGAIVHVYGRDDAYFWSWGKLRESLRRDGFCDIVDFNNAPKRTHAEVLAAVRKAGI